MRQGGRRPAVRRCQGQPARARPSRPSARSRTATYSNGPATAPKSAPGARAALTCAPLRLQRATLTAALYARLGRRARQTRWLRRRGTSADASVDAARPGRGTRHNRLEPAVHRQDLDSRARAATPRLENALAGCAGTASHLEPDAPAPATTSTTTTRWAAARAARSWSAGLRLDARRHAPASRPAPAAATSARRAFAGVQPPHPHSGLDAELQRQHHDRRARSSCCRPTVDTAAMLDRLFGRPSRIRSLRQQAVQAYIAATGLPPRWSNSINFLSNRYYPRQAPAGRRRVAWRRAATWSLSVFERDDAPRCR